MHYLDRSTSVVRRTINQREHLQQTRSALQLKTAGSAHRPNHGDGLGKIFLDLNDHFWLANVFLQKICDVSRQLILSPTRGHNLLLDQRHAHHSAGINFHSLPAELRLAKDSHIVDVTGSDAITIIARCRASYSLGRSDRCVWRLSVRARRRRYRQSRNNEDKHRALPSAVTKDNRRRR